MIFEAIYWKLKLARLADGLERRTHQRRWPEASMEKVHQEVTDAAVTVRKLLEAHKLSGPMGSRKVRVERFRWNGKPVHRFNWTSGDAYEMVPESARIPLQMFCSQLIHSYTFAVGLTDSNSFFGVFFNSDESRKKWLYFVSVEELIEVFREVTADEVDAATYVYDTQAGEYRRVPIPKKKAS